MLNRSEECCLRVDLTKRMTWWDSRESNLPPALTLKRLLSGSEGKEVVVRSWLSDVSEAIAHWRPMLFSEPFDRPIASRMFQYQFQTEEPVGESRWMPMHLGIGQMVILICSYF